MTIELDLSEVGLDLPARSFGPITRTTLALYAGGSGDHNPIHIDLDCARQAGQPDVFAHGMLSMAYMAQYLSAFAPAERLRFWSVRFTAVTPTHALVTCSGRVTRWDDERREASIALKAHIGDGTQTMVGQAIIAV